MATALAGMLAGLTGALVLSTDRIRAEMFGDAAVKTSKYLRLIIHLHLPGERDEQALLRITRRPDGELRREKLGSCRFVDLVGEHGWAA